MPMAIREVPYCEGYLSKYIFPLISIFDGEASLLCLVSAIEMEISEEWLAGKRSLNMNEELENRDVTPPPTKRYFQNTC
jgi:hypothetical protein